MAMSFSRPDPSSPSAVSTATFTTSRRGFDQNEVRDLLRMVAAELARLQEREKFLERELRTAQRGNPNAAVALDEEVVTRLLGEEAARILQTAREAASQIKIRAEENSSRLLREATDEAQRLREEAEIESSRRRQDASADAEAELQMAKQQGRDMVNEARAYRERVLGELARRREMARQQIEQLVHGRDRLLQAFERARIAAVDVMAEMTPLGEPNEYVNLAPTTGPVPIMVPARDLAPRPAADEPVEVEEPAVDELVDEVVEELTEPVDHHVFDRELDDQPDDAADDVQHVDDQHDDDQHDDEQHDDRPIAPVVSLFAGEIPDTPRDSVGDLFAKLRASRSETVVERAQDAVEAETAEADEAEAETAEAVVEEPVVDELVVETVVVEELSVFQASPEAPIEVVEVDDSAFGRRDAELTPLIVASARKLKRVLADEQNDVLHVLRGAKPVASLSDLVPAETEHIRLYATAIDDDLKAAALAGASSVHKGTQREHNKAIKQGAALQPAIDALGTSIVQPLRERLERAVHDAGGDNQELANLVRAVYREWKTQRIDEHLDDVARMAFGRGALVALAPGTPICWAVDPNGPACPDAEDNALAGVVAAGDPFPTDHVCAPAHEGCRCMLQLAPR